MPSRISRLANFLPYLLAITSNAVSGRIAGHYEEQFGLKIPEWRVMAVLGDAGALTQRDLVGATLMDKVAVNRACKALEDRGLAERRPNAQDGRSHHLELTPSGRDMHRQIMAIALDMEAKVFAVLSPEERAAFKAMLDRLRTQATNLE
ncbi:MAG: MarR family winged helix-turn-helix transcriptional regulator [Novosphingobium sp.]